MNQQPSEASVVFVDEETCKEPYISWPYVFSLLSRKKGLWILIIVLCTVGACLFKGFTDPQIAGVMRDQYQTSALIYVSPIIGEENGDSMYTYDTSSSTLIKNVMQTLQQDKTMTDIADQLGFESEAEMMKHLEITNPSSSSFVQLNAIVDNSDTSYQIVERTLEAFDAQKPTLFPQANIITVQAPEIPKEPLHIGMGTIAKSMLKYGVLGLAGGILIDVVIIGCMTLSNSHFRDEKEVDYLFGVSPAACGSSPTDPKAMEVLRASLLLHPEEEIVLLTGLTHSDDTADALHKSLDASHMNNTLASVHELMKDAPQFASLSDFLCSPECTAALNKLSEETDRVLYGISTKDSISSLIPAALNADRVIFCISTKNDKRADVQKAWKALQESGRPVSIYLIQE